MIQETIINEVRQRLGPLNSQAEQAVKEVLEILKLPREATSPETQEEPFIGTNVSVAQYEAWSRDERLKYQTDPEKINARWIEKKMQELNVAWIMVIDGLVVASGSLTDYPSDEEFDALCEKFGKFPFVFLSPRVLMIEENVSQHLGKNFRYVQRPLWLEVTDKHGKSQHVGMIALCIEQWQSSPFVAINPQRIALVGREAFLKLQPIVHLDFAARQTEIEYERIKGI
ncbi:hypothetical protein L0337_12095 [candidate division KSB1 bacterium]|nr:hypothetical protein [candidate division KSB1 bacterium]